MSSGVSFSPDTHAGFCPETIAGQGGSGFYNLPFSGPNVILCFTLYGYCIKKPLLMNKAQLTELVRQNLGGSATKKAADYALAAVLDSIAEGIEKDGKVQILGFGTFLVKTRAARTGRNPKTGEPMTIPASTMVSFKASSSLKD